MLLSDTSSNIGEAAKLFSTLIIEMRGKGKKYCRQEMVIFPRDIIFYWYCLKARITINRITVVIFEEDLWKWLAPKYKQAFNFIPYKIIFCVKITGLPRQVIVTKVPWKKCPFPEKMPPRKKSPILSSNLSIIIGLLPLYTKSLKFWSDFLSRCNLDIIWDLTAKWTCTKSKNISVF